MTGVRFEWDEAKNIANQRKHGVSFETASRVFSDPFYLSVKDRVEDGEQRWHAFGVVGGTVLLMAAHTTWEAEIGGALVERVRMISAREATP